MNVKQTRAFGYIIPYLESSQNPPWRCSCCTFSEGVWCPLLISGRADFLEAAQRGNLVPVYRRIFDDHLTPVLAYRCLVKEDDREAPSFLFESVENGKNINMVSFLSVLWFNLGGHNKNALRIVFLLGHQHCFHGLKKGSQVISFN